MRQSSLTGFEKYTKKTRKELFLEEMDRIIPWCELMQALKPYYPDPTGPGRRRVLPRFHGRLSQVRFLLFECLHLPATSWIVEAFDVVKDIRSGPGMRLVPATIDALMPQHAEEALAGRIVGATAYAAHRAKGTDLYGE